MDISILSWKEWKQALEYSSAIEQHARLCEPIDCILDITKIS